MNEAVALSELVEVNPRSSQPRLGESVSFVAMDDVTEGGDLARVQVRNARPGYTPFREDDVLLAKITPCLENGKGAHAVGLPVASGQGSTEFHVLRARHKVSSRFVYHWTRTQELRLAAEAMMTGSAGQRRVPAEFFDRFTVARLSFKEQRRIAEILDTIDEVIHATERLVEKRKLVRRGLVDRLIVDREAEFRVSRLGDLSTRITSGSRGWAAYYSNAGEVFLRIGNLSREHPNLRRLDEPKYVRPPASAEEERTRCEPGDLLISITADLGIVGVIPSSLPRSYVNQHIARIRLNPSHAHVRFIAHALQSEIGQRQFRFLDDPGAKAGLNLPAIGSLRVPVPAIEVQEQIARVIDDVQQSIDADEASISKLRMARFGLASDLLSGRIRTVA
jgi:type I restriction enzyme, S subunit